MIGVAVMLAQVAPTQGPAWQERHFPPALVVPACAFERPAREVRLLRALPAQVQAELSRFFGRGGGLADVDGEFNATDVIDDRKVPQRRFIRAYLTDDVWFIWFEQGGLARHVSLVALRRGNQQAGSPADYRVAPNSYFSGNLCAASKAFLAGAWAGP